MPAYFTLTKKGETEPSRFVDIDDAMCAHFGVTPDTERYHRAWYDTEGLGLAMGHDWARLREINPERTDIINWLEANYTANSWYSRG